MQAFLIINKPKITSYLVIYFKNSKLIAQCLPASFLIRNTCVVQFLFASKHDLNKPKQDPSSILKPNLGEK